MLQVSVQTQGTQAEVVTASLARPTFLRFFCDGVALPQSQGSDHERSPSVSG